MNEIYSALWKLAKPYYLRGRPMDVDHIEWMMEEAMYVCQKEHIDDTILLPAVILHDVGYAEVPKENPFKLDIRRAHMKAGAEIARKLLREVQYPEEKIERIAYIISVHDNWAFDDVETFANDKMVSLFNDLDYMWTATPKGFPAVMKILNIDAKGLLEWLETNDKPIERPFVTATTKELYEKYLSDRRKDVAEM